MFKILLITPPLVQINTPYPATAYLKGFLNSKNIYSFQMDLGLELVLELFSKRGVHDMKNYISHHMPKTHEIYKSFVWNNIDDYMNTMDVVISFLQNKNSTTAFSINTRQFLPEGRRFDVLEMTEEMFGDNAVQDKARHIATLYIEDFCDFISDFIDPNFGLSRYAESIARSAQNFDEMYDYLMNTESYIMTVCYEILKNKINDIQPDAVAFSIPFPGNLTSALSMSRRIKQDFSSISIIFGGGYCNTELRQIHDRRFFEFVDFMTLDDGERPIENIIQYLTVHKHTDNLKRTFMLSDHGELEYHDNKSIPDYHSKDLPTPTYSDLKINDYLSVIDLVNPMHRLWSDGRWNKMILAHGCYWAKCTFCDINLSYIADYHHASSAQIVDHIETLISETGHRGFHFVDEAAPPALIKEVALEIIRRQVKITWWTNIRFEKSFTRELCQLMVQSGCIAVSGGLEVASNRLLQLIQKGVTVEQVAQVCHNFKQSGILVHAYLMYGFPTQTEQETIDSLEMVRQMFELNILESAYWHKFTMTIHSPCGKSPESFQVQVSDNHLNSFANNDVEHTDIHGAEHDSYTEGLNKALYNYMYKNCLDWPLEDWFEFRVLPVSVPKNYIKNAITHKNLTKIHAHKELVWLGTIPKDNHYVIEDGVMHWTLYNKNRTLELELEVEYGMYLFQMLEQAHISNEARLKVSDWKSAFNKDIPDDDFDDFMLMDIYDSFNEMGLLYL